MSKEAQAREAILTAIGGRKEPFYFSDLWPGEHGGGLLAAAFNRLRAEGLVVDAREVRGPRSAYRLCRQRPRPIGPAFDITESDIPY